MKTDRDHQRRYELLRLSAGAGKKGEEEQMKFGGSSSRLFCGCSILYLCGSDFIFGASLINRDRRCGRKVKLNAERTKKGEGVEKLAANVVSMYYCWGLTQYVFSG